MKRVPTRSPRGVDGATTIVGTRLVEEESFSSKVMKRTSVRAWYWELATIPPTTRRSHASPVDTGQLCMSSQMLGTTIVKAAPSAKGKRSGTSFERHVAAREV